MNFTELAAERYSVRKFKEDKLPREVIDEILAAGHLAPTGCNNQPQRILVLTSDEAVQKLKGCTKCHFDAPAALLVSYHKNECWQRKYDGALCGEVDAAIVTTHMMLKAHELGIGTTWVMHFDPFAMRETYHLPEELVPVALLVMGYPAEDAQPSAMHGTFRPLAELVQEETY